MQHDSITIFIPAYNEEQSIQQSIQSVINEASSLIPDYEIFVVNDGSTDRTKEIVEKEIKKNPRIRLISHKENTGLGTCFRDAIKHASKQYFCGYPGDGDISTESFCTLLKERKDNTVIIQYLENQEQRVWIRKTLSRLYTSIISFFFGTHLRYYNGYCLSPTSFLQTISLRSTGHTIFSEILIRLVKKGYPYKEIPFLHLPHTKTHTHAFTPANMFRVGKGIFTMFVDIQIRGRI